MYRDVDSSPRLMSVIDGCSTLESMTVVLVHVRVGNYVELICGIHYLVRKYIEDLTSGLLCNCKSSSSIYSRFSTLDFNWTKDI